MAHIGLPRAYADSFARDTSCDPFRAFPTTSRYGTETSSRLRIDRQAPHAGYPRLSKRRSSPKDWPSLISPGSSNSAVRSLFAA